MMKMDLSHPAVKGVSESLRSKMMTSAWWRFAEEPGNSSLWSDEMTTALKAHWTEYLMEATGLGVLMISACAFGVLLFHPSSPVSQTIASDTARRVLMGVAM